MRKSNGFVFMETIVVVSVLSITLMTLFSSFSFLIKKSRERETYDTTSYIYKTFLVVKELERQAGTRATMKDSIVGYISQAGNKCICYNLTTGAEVNCSTVNPEANQSVVNKFDKYLVSCDLAENNNSNLRLLAQVYKIEKFYLITPEALSTSAQKKNIYKKIDATSIDYLNAKHLINKQLFMVKYKEEYVGQTNDLNKTNSIFFASMEVGMYE